MNAVYCILLSLFFFSCKENRLPRNILPPAAMEKLMWEQMRADGFIKDYLSKDTSKNISRENVLLQEKIFRKYKTTGEVFYKSYDYYLQHDNMMRDLLDSIIAKEVRVHEKEKITLKINKNEQALPER